MKTARVSFLQERVLLLVFLVPEQFLKTLPSIRHFYNVPDFFNITLNFIQ